MVSSSAAEKFLAAPFLIDVDAASRQAVLNVLVEGRAPEGTVLVRQDELNDKIFFLIEGTASILRKYPEGNVESVAELAAPAVFGESSFFRRTPSVVSTQAKSAVRFLTLDHHAHDLLRRADPRAAEQVALAAVRVLAEHFDLIDKRVSEFLHQHPEGTPKFNEWARFRASLFEGSNF